jgi:hypothetical protein
MQDKDVLTVVMRHLLISLNPFSFWQMYCLSFELRLLVVSLVSSIFSCVRCDCLQQKPLACGSQSSYNTLDHNSSFYWFTNYYLMWRSQYLLVTRTINQVKKSMNECFDCQNLKVWWWIRLENVALRKVWRYQRSNRKPQKEKGAKICSVFLLRA